MAGAWWVEGGPEARDQLGGCCNSLGERSELAGELGSGRARLGEAASGVSLGAGQSLVQGCGGPSHDSGNGQCWGV